MKIQLNGEQREVVAGTRLKGLLEQLSMHERRVAVMINEEIVPRDRFDEVEIAEGDKVELITLAGGG